MLQKTATGSRWGDSRFAALFGLLAAPGVHRADVSVALPVEPATRIHQRHALVSIATMDEVGHMLGRFHSVHLMERKLS